MATNFPINPRIRAYGKARLDIAGRATSPAEWEKLWKQPANAFPFVWGESWKQCVEYRVDDFPAEVGFFIDILGLPINALDPGYAMFTSPQGDFYFSVVPTPPMEPATPPNAIRLQFMVKDLLATTLALQQRGIDFELPAQPLHPGASLSIASFRTPHGISIELWGKLEPEPPALIELNQVKDDGNGGEPGDEDDDFDLTEDGDEEDEMDDQPSPGDDGSEDDDDIEPDVEEDSEASDDDDSDEDQDDDEEEDYDFDEDDDEDDDFDEGDLDGDEYASQKTNPPKNASHAPTQLPLESRLIAPNKPPQNLKDTGPEYVDLDVT